MPSQCPPGTQLDATTDSANPVCNDCGAGKFCWPCPKDQYCYGGTDTSGTGHDGEHGDCEFASGFVCRSGAHSPKPTYNGYDLIQPGSVAFNTYSGPVIRGYIAADNSGALTESPISQWQPTFYGTAFVDCMAGRYCPETAMDDLSAYSCRSGYYCLGGNAVDTPTNELDGSGAVIGDVCSAGKYCSGVLIHEMDC